MQSFSLRKLVHIVCARPCQICMLSWSGFIFTPGAGFVKLFSFATSSVELKVAQIMQEKQHFPSFMKSPAYIKLLADLDLLKDFGSKSDEEGKTPFSFLYNFDCKYYKLTKQLWNINTRFTCKLNCFRLIQRSKVGWQWCKHCIDLCPIEI